MWTKDLKLAKTWQAHDYAVMGLAENEATGSIFTSSVDGEIKEFDSKSGDFRRMTVMLGANNDLPSCVKSLVCNNGLLYAGDMAGVVIIPSNCH